VIRFPTLGLLFKVLFIQDSGLFRVLVYSGFCLFKVLFIQGSGLFRVLFIQGSGEKTAFVTLTIKLKAI
jgi:hypothetical protein